MRRHIGRLVVAGVLAAVSVGCGIVELETEDPDGLDVEDPLVDPDADPGPAEDAAEDDAGG